LVNIIMRQSAKVSSISAIYWFFYDFSSQQLLLSSIAWICACSFRCGSNQISVFCRLLFHYIIRLLTQKARLSYKNWRNADCFTGSSIGAVILACCSLTKMVDFYLCS
jgi:hypothetical protein